MSAPRPSRGARWGIGLAVSGVLLLVGVVAGAVAIGQAAAGGGPCVTEPGAPGLFCTDDQYSGRAVAYVLAAEPVRETPTAGSFDAHWIVDLQFDTEAGEEVTAREVGWPYGAEVPLVGVQVGVAYDPVDPEFFVVSAKSLDDAAARAASDGGAVSPAALWTTGAGFAAALAALLGTVVWARRAPRPERPVPAWSAPGYGYLPGCGAPGYAYPPPGYGPPPGHAYPPPGYGPPPSGPPVAPPVAPPSAPPSAPPPGWDLPG